MNITTRQENLPPSTSRQSICKSKPFSPKQLTLTVSHCRVEVVANRAKRIVVAIILQFIIGSLLSQLTIAVPFETNSVLWQTPIGTDRIDATTLAAEFMPNRFLVQTFVNVDASLPVVVQHVALGANAERPPQRVEAGVRAAPIVDRAFIDVLAAVAVLREASSRQARTAAPVATPNVDTCILAGPVAVPQQTLVHICKERSHREWKLF